MTEVKKKTIPQFTLPEIAVWNQLPKKEQSDYNLSTVEPGCTLQVFPYRTTFYGIGMCKVGSIELKADLHSYKVIPGSLIIMVPEVVRSWCNQSTDYLNQAFFFTDEFLTQNNSNFKLLRNFKFFESSAPKVLQLEPEAIDQMWKLLQEIKCVVMNDSIRKKDIIRGYLIIILNIVADYFDWCNPPQPTPGILINELTERFKRAVSENYMALRLDSDYANLLNITSKHLSETVKTVTGKTAGQWIDDMLILEAKVMLKQTDYDISHIALHMNFSDVSAFGKFFRRHTGMSSVSYRKLQQSNNQLT